jgi:hypothetical protein
MIDETTIRYYRDTFGTDSGKKVLAHLLADLGLYDNNLKTTEEIALSNYAKTILMRLGIIGTQNLDYYANMFMNAPLILGKEENDRTE